MKKISVIAIDDHDVVLDGVYFMLSGYPDIEILGLVKNSTQLKDVLKTKVPDIIILDIKLNNESGLNLALNLLKKYPKIRIIALTVVADENTIFQSIKAGLMGYLPKETSKVEIYHAIKTVMTGKKYFGSDISQSLLEKFNGIGNNPLDLLTDNEIQIIRDIADGLPQKNIAHKICLSLRTVENMKKNIHKKLNIPTTAGIIKFAIKHKLTEL